MPFNVTIMPANSARNLDVIFDSAVFMSRFCVEVLFCPSPSDNKKHSGLHNNAHSIATSLIHSKLDYCNSLFVNLPQSHLTHSKFYSSSCVQNSKFLHIAPDAQN